MIEQQVDTDNNSVITRNELLDTCVKIFNHDRLKYKSQYHKSTEGDEVNNKCTMVMKCLPNVRYFDEDHNAKLDVIN